MASQTEICQMQEVLNALGLAPNLYSMTLKLQFYVYLLTA
uniref:Myosin motor domain-containing protein n=1 Tax=Heterorhabditis bacteriophora TaxID=37862 RepID=A0A1I7X0X7_HETBA